jgi:hypothetical protein
MPIYLLPFPTLIPPFLRGTTQRGSSKSYSLFLLLNMVEIDASFIGTDDNIGKGYVEMRLASEIVHSQHILGGIL